MKTVILSLSVTMIALVCMLFGGAQISYMCSKAGYEKFNEVERLRCRLEVQLLKNCVLSRNKAVLGEWGGSGVSGVSRYWVYEKLDCGWKVVLDRKGSEGPSSSEFSCSETVTSSDGKCYLLGASTSQVMQPRQSNLVRVGGIAFVVLLVGLFVSALIGYNFAHHSWLHVYAAMRSVVRSIIAVVVFVAVFSIAWMVVYIPGDTRAIREDVRLLNESIALSAAFALYSTDASSLDDDMKLIIDGTLITSIVRDSVGGFPNIMYMDHKRVIWGRGEYTFCSTNGIVISGKYVPIVHVWPLLAAIVYIVLCGCCIALLMTLARLSEVACAKCLTATSNNPGFSLE